VAVSAVVLALAALAVVPGLLDDEPDVPAGELRIATGDPLGVYFAYGEGIADVVRARIPLLRPRVIATPASVANVEMVHAGTAEIGFTQADVAADRVAVGVPLVALARLHDDYLHVVVRADGPIRTVADLRGKRVSLGVTGSGTEITAERLLYAARLDPRSDVQKVPRSLSDSAAAFERGEIDAFFFSGGLPVPQLLALKARQVDFRLLDTGDLVAPLRALPASTGGPSNSRPYYRVHVIPRTAYGLPEAVSTLAVPNYLVVRADMPADTAYAIIRAIFEGRRTIEAKHLAAGRLNIRDAINTDPLPLHEGAARYYQETKP
jgi:TRAP transporter TAXI family solute receptor